MRDTNLEFKNFSTGIFSDSDIQQWRYFTQYVFVHDLKQRQVFQLTAEEWDEINFIDF